MFLAITMILSITPTAQIMNVVVVGLIITKPKKKPLKRGTDERSTQLSDIAKMEDGLQMKEFIPEQHELKQLISGMQDYLNSDYTDYCGYEMSKKDVDTALTYLKDIPIVKPSMCEVNENFATCGICEKVITVEYSFCPFCGTCIDWDREDGF